MNIHNGHDGEDGNRDDDDVDDDAGNNHDEQDDYRDDDGEPEAEQQVVDNSGLKLYYTQSLRNFDAGVLSVGIDPNWRHIIPPGQEKVVSEGHCIGACTQQSFPQEGINIFAVMTRTHLIGRQVKLRQVSSSRVLDFSAAPSEGIQFPPRFPGCGFFFLLVFRTFFQIRGNEELQPIVHDTNVDPSYQDYRWLPAPVKALPGDSLIAECIYDSSSRKSITLGKTRSL